MLRDDAAHGRRSADPQRLATGPPSAGQQTSDTTSGVRLDSSLGLGQHAFLLKRFRAIDGALPLPPVMDGDFVLYDEPHGAASHADAAPFQKAAFQGYRGPLPDGSPLLDEAAYPHASAHAPSSLRQDSPALRSTGSPTTLTPPPQPSSGSLGAPLHLLSLQSDDPPGSASPHLAPLFPKLGADSTATTSASSSPNYVMTPPAQLPADQRPWIAPTGDLNSLSFLWKPQDQTLDGAPWKTPWDSAGAQDPARPAPPATAASAAMDAAAARDDKLTVSPRDLHIDYEEATTPQAKSHPLHVPSDVAPQSLFPPMENMYELPSSSQMLASGMEMGSSTEEEDDEDEKPFPSASGDAAALGTTQPNEALLMRWSQPIYGGGGQDMDHSGRTGIPMRPRFGPSFSSVSTSSESEEDMSDRAAAMRAAQASQTATPSLQRQESAQLAAYGYFPRSQDSMQPSSMDSDAAGTSNMAANAIDNDTPGRSQSSMRSPSILQSAEAIEPTPAPRALTPTHEPPRRQPPRAQRADPATLAATSPKDTSDSDELDAEGDSDYEQSVHVVQPTPRATARRGRGPRTMTGAHRRTASGTLAQGPLGHPPSTSPTRAGTHRTTSPTTGSAIRCDYVSPVTHQMCGTVFHRMYDLARHRITLHLREEAQMVKDGLLKVEQCVVLGKEVDVHKTLAELEWTCRMCGATFSRKDAMLRHERLRHQKS